MTGGADTEALTPAARLCGRIIVVSGAVSGQGAAETRALSNEGATVVALGVDRDWAGGSTGDKRVLRRRHDVGSREDWEALAADLDGRFGAVHGLINNAGVTSRVRLGAVELEDWDRVLRINVTGAMLAMQAVLPLIGRGASIVDVGSVAALGGHYAAAYTTSNGRSVVSRKSQR